MQADVWLTISGLLIAIIVPATCITNGMMLMT